MLQVMVALVLVQDYLVAKEELALSQATPLALVCNKYKECMVTVCIGCNENTALLSLAADSCLTTHSSNT